MPPKPGEIMTNEEFDQYMTLLCSRFTVEQMDASMTPTGKLHQVPDEILPENLRWTQEQLDQYKATLVRTGEFPPKA